MRYSTKHEAKPDVSAVDSRHQGCRRTWALCRNVRGNLQAGGGKMGKYSKLRERILAGDSDRNIEFSALCQLLIRLGFDERIKGSHHIFTRDDVIEVINLQPKLSKAKAYQVKQIRGILVKYRSGGSDVD
jgi:predicted RNA binding protein YcfA (HicA-like mRNA interferase family)